MSNNMPLVIVLIVGLTGYGVYASGFSFSDFNEAETVVIEDEVSLYKDGVYEATTTYSIPYGYREPMKVLVELKDNKVASTSVLFDVVDYTSEGHQESFVNLFRTRVLGRRIDEISLSRIGGASLTSRAYNKALEQIKIEAAI